jgi:hypothetical protein
MTVATRRLGVNRLTDVNAGLVSRRDPVGSYCYNSLNSRLKTIRYKRYLVIELIFCRDGTAQEWIRTYVA